MYVRVAASDPLPLFPHGIIAALERDGISAEEDPGDLAALGPGSNQDTRTAQLDQLATRIRAWTGNRAQIIEATMTTLVAMTAADDRWSSPGGPTTSISPGPACWTCSARPGPQGQDHAQAVALLQTVNLDDPTDPACQAPASPLLQGTRSTTSRSWSPARTPRPYSGRPAPWSQARALVDAAKRP